MAKTFYQTQFNNSIVTGLLFSNLSVSDKERKLQEFVHEAEERYDVLCDNISQLLLNKQSNNDINTLYLTVDGFSFVSDLSLDQGRACVPVLTINKYSPECPDILAYIEVALCHFSSYCNFSKNTILSLGKSI